MKKEINAVAMSTATYAVYICSNPQCQDGEFAERVQPIYMELPRCPCCGSLAQIGEVLSRESWG